MRKYHTLSFPIESLGKRSWHDWVNRVACVNAEKIKTGHTDDVRKNDVPDGSNLAKAIAGLTAFPSESLLMVGITIVGKYSVLNVAAYENLSSWNVVELVDGELIRVADSGGGPLYRTADFGEGVK